MVDLTSSAVTSVQAEYTDGLLYYNPSLTVKVAYDTDFKDSGSGWLNFGYGSTDGASIEQSADSNDKKVWGANFGAVYSNFKDIAKVKGASFRNATTMAVLFGSANAVSDKGILHVKVKNRQGTKGTFVICGHDDEGNRMLWVYRGQTSPEISYDLKEDDVITYELKITGISQSDGTSSELYVSDPDYTAPVGG